MANDLILTTKLKFKNLTKSELGVLMTALGVIPEHSFALKIGNGKPIGMGTVIVKVEQLELCSRFESRYLSYNHNEDNFQNYTGENLNNFLKEINQLALSEGLLKNEQLTQLKEILAYPTTRKAPESNY
jgi:hypothetical protein